MFKDQPVFCNCLKILTTEGLPESHFYLQFPSSGLPAVKNLEEPQKEEQLAHRPMTMSNYSASGNHRLYFPMTKGWQRSPAGDCGAGRCHSHVLPGIQQSRLPTRLAWGTCTTGCTTSASPDIQVDSVGSSEDAKGSGVLSMAVMQHQGLFF